MTDIEQQARDIMSRIRHQIFTPEVTTMGNCPKCGGRRRGSGVCAGCLGNELDEVCGRDGSGLRYVVACRRNRDAELGVLRRAEALAGGGE